MNGQIKNIQQGFTLVEILLTLGIVAILLSHGIPYMRDAILSQRVKNTASDLQISLNFARSEAIKRNASIDIIPTGTWNGGWTIQTVAPAPILTLKTMDAYSDLTISGPAGNITYLRSGRLSSAVTSFQVSIAGNSAIAMRCVNISINGMPNAKIDSDSNTANGCN
ncbi:MAG: GspH/FimT family pseudopilin [Magnetococcales bacterium]|nr:GspH/FimT family pseudopilin [Magnetococcales bacterium]